MSAIEQYTQAVVHTCLVYTVELFPDRIQLLQELPRQCHIGHCWGNQTVPLRTKNRDSYNLTHSLSTFSPDTLGSRFSSGTSTELLHHYLSSNGGSQWELQPSILGADKPLIPWERRTSCEDMCESYRVSFSRMNLLTLLSLVLAHHHFWNIHNSQECLRTHYTQYWSSPGHLFSLSVIRPASDKLYSKLPCTDMVAALSGFSWLLTHLLMGGANSALWNAHWNS